MTLPWLARTRTRIYRLQSALLRFWYRKVWGMDIGKDVQISRSAKLDRTNPRGVHIGDRSLVSFDAAILTHDFVGGRHLDTWIGSCCFVGARVVVMPGVRIGDHSVIGAGSVVTRDVPAHSIAIGNPARVVREGIQTAKWGIMDPRMLTKEGVIAPGTDSQS